MALIVCPECKQQVSDSAETCPGCGYPISKAGAQPRPAPMQAPQSRDGSEETRWEGRASLRAAVPHFIRLLVTTAVVIVVFQVFLARTPEWICKASDKLCSGLEVSTFETAWGYAVWVEVAVLVLLVLRFVRAVLEVKSIFVRVTNQRIISEWGILSKHIDEIDLRIVDDTSSRQGVLHNLLGIGDVVVISEDRTHPRLLLRGMEDPQGLREMIRSEVYSHTSKQKFFRPT